MGLLFSATQMVAVLTNTDVGLLFVFQVHDDTCERLLFPAEILVHLVMGKLQYLGLSFVS